MIKSTLSRNNALEFVLAEIQYCRVCDGCVGVLYVYGPANEPEHVHRDWNDPPKLKWNERQELGSTDIIVIPTHTVHVKAEIGRAHV